MGIGNGASLPLQHHPGSVHRRADCLGGAPHLEATLNLQQAAFQHRRDLEQLHDYEHSMILQPKPNTSRKSTNWRRIRVIAGWLTIGAAALCCLHEAGFQSTHRPAAVQGR
jgi:hypothetical protein